MPRGEGGPSGASGQAGSCQHSTRSANEALQPRSDPSLVMLHRMKGRGRCMRRTSPGWRPRASWQRRRPASPAPAPAQANRQAQGAPQCLQMTDDRAIHLICSNACLSLQCIIWSDSGAAMECWCQEDSGCCHSKSFQWKHEWQARALLQRDRIISIAKCR